MSVQTQLTTTGQITGVRPRPNLPPPRRLRFIRRLSVCLSVR